MSDTDSLDGLLDDIDMDTLVDSKEDTNKSSLAISSNQKSIANEEDLDDLLDDFFGDEDTTAAGGPSFSSATSAKAEDSSTSDDIDDDGGLTAHLQLQKTRDLERALHTIPSADMKNKWMHILQEDIKLEDSSSPFKRSYSYLEWQDPVEHFAADKSLRNVLLRACSKSNMSDDQAKRLQDVLFHDPELLKKYCKQIVEEKSPEIKKNEDFSEEKCPSLWKSVGL